LVLTQGITFLFDQAREALKSWREKTAARAKSESAVADHEQVVKRATVESVELPGGTSPALTGTLNPAHVEAADLEVSAEALSLLRRSLAEYAEEGRPVDPDDPALLETVGALRGLLERLYGQRITFAGESRPGTGTRVEGFAGAEAVRGYLAGIRSRGLLEGVELKGHVKAGVVEDDGQAVAVDLDLRGGRSND